MSSTCCSRWIIQLTHLCFLDTAGINKDQNHDDNVDNKKKPPAGPTAGSITCTIEPWSPLYFQWHWESYSDEEECFTKHIETAITLPSGVSIEDHEAVTVSLDEDQQSLTVAIKWPKMLCSPKLLCKMEGKEVDNIHPKRQGAHRGFQALRNGDGGDIFSTTTIGLPCVVDTDIQIEWTGSKITHERMIMVTAKAKAKEIYKGTQKKKRKVMLV